MVKHKKPKNKKIVKKKSSIKKKVSKKVKNVNLKKPVKVKRPKKVDKKGMQEKIRKNAPATQYFILCNGQRVKNVKELADTMEYIEEEVFNHHANPEKNDFVNWVKDVFKEVKLAEKIAKAKNKEHVQLIIYKHIANKLW